MANGVKSMFAFWMGGACVIVGAAPPPATFVVGSIDIYPAVDGRPTVNPAVDGRPRLNDRGR